MKKRVFIAGGILLACSCLYLLGNQKLFANEDVNDSPQNPTVMAFLKAYKNSSETEINSFFSSTSDNDKVIVAPEGGFFFQRADAEGDGIVAAAVDDNGNEVPGTELNLDGKDATTVAQLKQVLEKARS